MLSDGLYTVVMNPYGQIYAKKDVPHPHLSWGSRVASALEIEIRDGRVTRILPRTGHYWELFRDRDGHLDLHLNWQNFVNELVERGADLRGVEISNIYYRPASLFNHQLVRGAAVPMDLYWMTSELLKLKRKRQNP